MAKSKITIREVAKAAGVSLGTASRALNRTGRVSEQAIEAVSRVARELGYEPNALAQSMRSLPKVLFVDVRSHFVLSPLLQKPGCHVPQSLLHRARLICKAFRRNSMAEATV